MFEAGGAKNVKTFKVGTFLKKETDICNLGHLNVGRLVAHSLILFYFTLSFFYFIFIYSNKSVFFYLKNLPKMFHRF